MALPPSSVPAAQGDTISGCQLPMALDIACDDEPANLTHSRKSGTGKLEYGDDWQLRQKPKDISRVAMTTEVNMAITV